MVRAKECSVSQMQNVAEAHPKVVDSALVKMAGKEMGEIVSVSSIRMSPLRFECFLFAFVSFCVFGRCIRVMDVSSWKPCFVLIRVK